jgi:ubiquinone biosynthesis protein
MGILVKYGFEEVASALHTKFSFGLRGKTLSGKMKREKKQRSRPERVRLALEELGPMFVKLGQLLSTRPDLIPRDYINELEKLQDRVKPEDSRLMKEELEKGLGEKADKIFEKFDDDPLAAGSIAQVHRARLKDGTEVVVKIRRPDILDDIRGECAILDDLASIMKKTVFSDSTIDPERMVGELSEAVMKEADLGNERRNQIRFIQNFKNDETIHVPEVFEDYCCDSVLTMEYIDGLRPGDREKVRSEGLDPKKVAARGADFVLKQIFEFGFFHTDPHPGNFFLLEDNVLAPLDFGQVARLSRKDTRLLNEMVLAVVEGDAENMIAALERENMVSERTDTEKTLRDFEQMLDTYRNLPLRDIPFNSVMSETFDIIRQNYIRPAPQFTLMLKSMMTAESFATGLDPDFDIVEYLKPYAKKYSLGGFEPKDAVKNLRKAFRQAGGLAARLPDDFNSIIEKVRKGKFQMRIHHEHLENLTTMLDRSSNRVSFSLIIAALLVASSMLVTQEGMVLGVVSLQVLGLIGYIAAVVMGMWLLISMMKSGHF